MNTKTGFPGFNNLSTLSTLSTYEGLELSSAGSEKIITHVC